MNQIFTILDIKIVLFKKAYCCWQKQKHQVSSSEVHKCQHAYSFQSRKEKEGILRDVLEIIMAIVLCQKLKSFAKKLLAVLSYQAFQADSILRQQPLRKGRKKRNKLQQAIALGQASLRFLITPFSSYSVHLVLIQQQ